MFQHKCAYRWVTLFLFMCVGGGGGHLKSGVDPNISSAVEVSLGHWRRRGSRRQCQDWWWRRRKGTHQGEQLSCIFEWKQCFLAHPIVVLSWRLRGIDSTVTLPAKVCCRVVPVLTIYTVELCLLQQKSDSRRLPVTADVCCRTVPVTTEEWL